MRVKGATVGDAPSGQPGRPFGQALRAGFSRLLGFGLGVAILAAASIVAVPAMVRASGPEAAAAIVTGQAIGAIAAVLIAYSWGITGPVAVARGDRRRRLLVYGESLTVRLLLWVPCSAAAALLASTVARSNADLAALGAISAASVGLTSSWYFVGLARPFALLTLETIPRVVGTVAGIALMNGGASAAAGLWGQFGGMAAGFLAATVWIVSVGGQPDGWWQARTRIRVLLKSQFSGVVATSIPAVYAALPIVIVGFVNPAAQPSFAIIDKFMKQASAALFPIVTVLQGWVPRARGSLLRWRIRRSVQASAAGAVVLAVVMALFGQQILTWLAAGQIAIDQRAVVLSGVALGLALVSQVINRVCLVAIDRVRYVAAISAIGAGFGVVLTAVLTPTWGTVGAVLGVTIGSAVKVGLGLRGLREPPAAPASDGH